MARPPVSDDEDWVTFAFNRGRADYKAGKAQPPRPPEDGAVTVPAHARWYGWMVERGSQLLKAMKVKEMMTGNFD